jgi:peptidyl-prolyl cis-trans isomerase C
MKRSIAPASQRIRVLAGCLTALLVLVAIEGCGKKEPAGPQGSGTSGAGANAGSSQPAKPKVDTVIAKVNGSPIKESELDGRIMRVITDQTGRPAAMFKPEAIEQFKKMMRVQVIDVMVSEKLLDQEIKAAGKEMTDADVVAEVNTQGAKMDKPMTFNEYKKLMIEKGQDFNDIMVTLRTDLARQKFIESKLVGKGDVNEAQAKAEYDKNVKSFEHPEEIRVSHILVIPAASDSKTDPNQAKLAAKQKAEKLLEKIKAGADFAALAKSDSNDGSAAKGGDLGWFRRGDMVKPFEDAAFALEPNKVSGVVETQFGYHIIKTMERRAAGTTSFEDAKKEIMTAMSEEARNKVVREYLESLHSKAKIEYTSPADAPTPEPDLDAVPAPAAEAKTPKADANQPKRPADTNQPKTPADPNKK